jgi:exopolysaccharide biosynthesis protein
LRKPYYLNSGDNNIGQERQDHSYRYTPQVHQFSHRGKNRKKQWPLYLVLALDMGIALVCLFLFCAYLFIFPRPLKAEGITDTAMEQPAPSATASQNTPPPAAGVSQPSAQTATAEPSTQPAQQPSPDTSGWYPEKYTSGEAVQTGSSYQSGNANISINKVQENGITYFVADIYIRNLPNLRTYFANDTYGTGYRQNVGDMAKANNAILAISGDYYGNQQRGVVIRNGEVFRKSVGSDVCVLYNDGTMKTFSPESFSLEETVAKGAYQAWSFGPRLLDNGQPMTEFNTSVAPANPRAAIGYYAPGHYCMVVVDGRQEGYSKGMTMKELSQLFYKLGCTEAYNLDGGQTAQMVFMGNTVNQPYNGGRSVSDIIAIGE